MLSDVLGRRRDTQPFWVIEPVGRQHGLDLDYMAVDRESYERARHPVDLRELVDEDVLVHLISGFRSRIGAGATIFCRTGESDTSGRPVLTRIDAFNNEALALRLYNPFCLAFRKEAAREQCCLESEAATAQRYVSGKWRGPTLYQCHAHLWEMAYPLSIGGTVLAVLITGQLALAPGKDATQKDLDGFPVDCESVQFSEVSQVEQIRNACPPESRAELGAVLDSSVAGQPADLTALLDRWNATCEFGRLTQALLDRFHKLGLRKEEDSLLLQISAELTNRTVFAESYWDEVGKMSRLVSELVGLGPLDVYSMRGSHYVQKIARGRAITGERPEQIPVSLTLNLDRDCLREVGHLNVPKQLLAGIAAGPNALLFTCDFPNVGQQSRSIIIVIHPPNDAEPLEDFALKFCRIIAQRSDVSGLLFEILAERRQFEDLVRRSSHASKTPLQAAISALETLDSLRATAEQYRNALPGIRKSILRAATEITEILSRSTESKRPLDLCDIVASLVEEMTPIANASRVKVVYQRPPVRVKAEVRELDIRTALRNLIDNAIKYSYQDNEVRIVLDIVGSRVARLVIRNYGIGIDPARLCQMAERGFRGNIGDHKADGWGRSRGGSGFGLPMATSDIEAHGGSLNLVSEPADEAPRESCHRFVTTATVTLPLVMETHDEE